MKAAALLLGAVTIFSAQVAQAQSAGSAIAGPYTITLPSTKTFSFSTSFNVPPPIQGSYVVRVQLSAPNSLTAASLKLNGAQIFSLSDFSGGVTSVDKTVTLLASDTIALSVAGVKNTRITITVFTVAMPRPTTLSPNPLALNAGTAGSLSATLSPAPTAPGTLTVSSSNSGIASVPASVSFASGQTSVAVPVTAVAAGSATVTVSANGGQATATVKVNALPTASLTAPANGAIYSAPASFALSATAADPDGSIAKVDFFDGGTLVGTATAAPYSVTLTNVAAGTHSFTARATDNLGATATSAAIIVTVDAPPTATLTVPANNAIFAEPANVTLSATASDAVGNVTKVDFYQGTTLLGTSTAAPYTFAWTGVPAGNYSLTAVATNDGGGTTTSAPVSIRVDSAPSVSLDAPANGAVFSGSTAIALSATATDTVGTITKVDFYQGTTLIGTATASPYTFGWTGAARGSYALTAVATNDAGMTATSSAVSIAVGAPPLIYGETPNGVTLPGGSMPEIGASYLGRGASIDVTTVLLQFDGQDVTSQATVTESGIVYLVTRPLGDATHTVALSVTDLLGSVATDTWTFATSDPAPNFYSETPRDVFVAVQNPRIRVLLSGFNIVASSISMSVDGADVTSQADVGVDHIVFTPSAPLDVGVHTVDVSATDANGVVGTKEWQFTVDIPPPPSTTQDGVRTSRTVIPQIRVLQ